MGVGIQREGRFGMTQDTGQGFGIYARGQGMGRKCVTQVVEPDVWQPCIGQKFL